MLRTCIHQSLKRTNNYNSLVLITRKRFLSTQQDPVTIYTGPLANVAKKLKLFSITSLGLGVGISPCVFAIDVPVPFIAKAALVGAGKYRNYFFF